MEDMLYVDRRISWILMAFPCQGTFASLCFPLPAPSLKGQNACRHQRQVCCSSPESLLFYSHRQWKNSKTLQGTNVSISTQTNHPFWLLKPRGLPFQIPKSCRHTQIGLWNWMAMKHSEVWNTSAQIPLSTKASLETTLEACTMNPRIERTYTDVPGLDNPCLTFISDRYSPLSLRNTRPHAESIPCTWIHRSSSVRAIKREGRKPETIE